MFKIKADYTIVDKDIEDMGKIWKYKMIQPLW